MSGPVIPDNLEFLTVEHPGCHVVKYVQDFSKSWICVQPDCDGEHHYFRAMVFIGPYLGDPEEPEDAHGQTDPGPLTAETDD